MTWGKFFRHIFVILFCVFPVYAWAANDDITILDGVRWGSSLEEIKSKYEIGSTPVFSNSNIKYYQVSLTGREISNLPGMQMEDTCVVGVADNKLQQIEFYIQDYTGGGFEWLKTRLISIFGVPSSESNRKVFWLGMATTVLLRDVVIDKRQGVILDFYATQLMDFKSMITNPTDEMTKELQEINGFRDLYWGETLEEIRKNRQVRFYQNWQSPYGFEIPMYIIYLNNNETGQVSSVPLAGNQIIGCFDEGKLWALYLVFKDEYNNYGLLNTAMMSLYGKAYEDSNGRSWFGPHTSLLIKRWAVDGDNFILLAITSMNKLKSMFPDFSTKEGQKKAFQIGW